MNSHRPDPDPGTLGEGTHVSAQAPAAPPARASAAAPDFSYLAFTQLLETDFYGTHLLAATLLRPDPLVRIRAGTQEALADEPAVLAWTAGNTAHMLEDERIARERRNVYGERKDRRTRLGQFEAAVLAYRQEVVRLRGQGLRHAAARYAYRAQVCRRAVLLYERHLIGYLISGLLDLMGGYGYKPARMVLWYALAIGGFAYAYLRSAHGVVAPNLAAMQPQEWYQALTFSVSSFHGSGFAGVVGRLRGPVAQLALGEAICGLLLELTFATLIVRRILGRW